MRFLFFLILSINSSAFAMSCEETLLGDLAKIEKVFNNPRATTKQKTNAVQKIKSLVQSTVNSEALINLLINIDPLYKPLSYLERDRLVQTYLMKSENRALAIKRFDLFFSRFLDEVGWVEGDNIRSNFESGLERAEIYFHFMETLSQENSVEFARVLLNAINDQLQYVREPMRVNVDGLNTILERTGRYFYSENADNIDANHDDDDIGEVQSQDAARAAHRAEYLRKLFSELERPVPNASLKDLLRVDHDEKALYESNPQLQEDVELFADGDAASRSGALRPIIFNYRLIKHFLPILKLAGSPRMLTVLEYKIRTVAALLGDARYSIPHARFLAQLRRGDQDQEALVKKLASDREFKRTLFSATSLAGELKNPQRWLTIHDPEKIRAEIRAAFENSAALKARVGRALKQKLGYSWNEIEADPEFLRYYADEVYDAYVQEGGQSNIDEAFKLRYIRRVLPELKLGNRCGDCTSVGSVNFGPSTTWFYNPGYQIITFSKGSRFLGKINLALIDMAGQPSILIDALEFNPQALPGKPYYQDAKAALDYVLGFAKNLAASEGRQLYALVSSNSSEANSILKNKALTRTGPSEVKARFVYNEKTIRKVLSLSPDVQVRPFYQTVNFIGTENGIREVPDFNDPRLKDLELKVINPAQANNSALGELLVSSTHAEEPDQQQEYLRLASDLILKNPEHLAQIREIYGLPASVTLSWKFLATRLKQLYPSIARAPRFLSQEVTLELGNKIVLLFHP
jgi:hypothetical protein